MTFSTEKKNPKKTVQNKSQDNLWGFFSHKYFHPAILFLSSKNPQTANEHLGSLGLMDVQFNITGIVEALEEMRALAEGGIAPSSDLTEKYILLLMEPFQVRHPKQNETELILCLTVKRDKEFVSAKSVT